MDKQKLQEKLRTSLNSLCRLGIVHFLQNDSHRFIITESVFRFGADGRSGDDPHQAQLRMIRYDEAMSLKDNLSSTENKNKMTTMKRRMNSYVRTR